jgi:hypothetical protein
LRLLARSDDALQRTAARLLVAAVFMKAIGLKSIDGAENAVAPRARQRQHDLPPPRRKARTAENQSLGSD